MRSSRVIDTNCLDEMRDSGCGIRDTIAPPPRSLRCWFTKMAGVALPDLLRNPRDVAQGINADCGLQGRCLRGFRRFTIYELRFTLPLLIAILCTTGCHTGTLPDPNDVATAGVDTPDVIMKQLQVASDALNDRKANREINDQEFRLLMIGVSRRYLDQAKDRTLTATNASTWGQVYTSARDWQDAETALQKAVDVEKKPATADFHDLGDLIGDTLSLASAQAHLGKVPEAISNTRSVFNVPPKAKAPILNSILNDIVPSAARHGKYFLDLAALLNDGIEQEQQVLVDPNSDGGRAFLLARPHKIQDAWEEIALLDNAAGRKDLAQQALLEARLESMSNTKA